MIAVAYYQNIDVVDHSDHEISFHPTFMEHQNKYYKKIFLHLLDKVIWN